MSDSAATITHRPAHGEVPPLTAEIVASLEPDALRNPLRGPKRLEDEFEIPDGTSGLSIVMVRRGETGVAVWRWRWRGGSITLGTVQRRTRPADVAASPGLDLDSARRVALSLALTTWAGCDPLQRPAEIEAQLFLFRQAGLSPAHLDLWLPSPDDWIRLAEMHKVMGERKRRGARTDAAASQTIDPAERDSQRQRAFLAAYFDHATGQRLTFDRLSQRKQRNGATEREVKRKPISKVQASINAAEILAKYYGDDIDPNSLRIQMQRQLGSGEWNNRDELHKCLETLKPNKPVVFDPANRSKSVRDYVDARNAVENAVADFKNQK